jgi:hypothetical protein
MVYGVWCMLYGVWCMVYGVWCMVYECMVYGVCCVLYAVCVHTTRPVCRLTAPLVGLCAHKFASAWQLRQISSSLSSSLHTCTSATTAPAFTSACTAFACLARFINAVVPACRANDRSSNRRLDTFSLAAASSLLPSLPATLLPRHEFTHGRPPVHISTKTLAMGVWVHGCMGAWVYGYMGYGCVSA